MGNQHTADVRFAEDLFEEVVELSGKHATVRIYGYLTGAVDSSERRLEPVAMDLAGPVTTG